MSMQPIVSVIVPTTRDRVEFNYRIMKCFMAQDYPQKHIIFDYENGSVGEKRNRLCRNAIGDIIVHFDSDDMYRPDWISASVLYLLKSHADIVGLSKINFYDDAIGAAWRYEYRDESRPWVAGATMVYWKSFWECHPFNNINVGEDNFFAWGNAEVKPRIFAHEYVDGFLATIHEGNTSKKELNNIRYKRCGEEEEERLKILWKLSNREKTPQGCDATMLNK